MITFNKKIRVLITGGGAPGAAGIIRCLQHPGIELHCCDAEEEVAGRFLCEGRFFRVPMASSPDFVNVLLEKSKAAGIDVILPLVTRELLSLALEQEKFSRAGIKVIVSQPDGLDIANDKGKLHQFLEWRGIPVAAYQLAEQYEQAVQAISDLGYPGRAVCFKPCVSNGSRGFRIISSQVDKHDQLFNQKPYHTYISYQEILDILASAPFPRLLFSEYLPGDEYSVDCLLQEGKCLAAIPRIRLRMQQGISTKGQFVENPEIIKYCTEIVESLNLHGNIGIQVKQAADGSFKVLEINPRVQGTIVAASGAGVNLPLLAVYMETGHAITPDMLKVKWGTRFMRFWNEIYY